MFPGHLLDPVTNGKLMPKAFLELIYRAETYLVKKSKNFGIAVDDGDTVVLPRKKFKIFRYFLMSILDDKIL